jgi:RNA polymerase sigma-70 factor, ECF subfamily
VSTVIRRLRPVIRASSTEAGRSLGSRVPGLADGRPGRGAADALLVAAGLGDRAAFAAFYDLTSPLVYGLLSGVLAEAEAADRATEEVYLHMWQQAADFDPTGRSASATVLFVARQKLVGRIWELGRSRAGSAERAITGGPPRFPNNS